MGEDRVCPMCMAKSLDSSLRRFLQNPGRVLEGYVREGTTVLDFGCGPGFFTLEIAKRVGDSGLVIAADLQEGMLELISRKLQGSGLESRVKLHRCSEEGIGLSREVDLVFAFYVMHELPDQSPFLKEFRSIMNPEGVLYIAEPKAHVSRRDFDRTLELAEEVGFSLVRTHRRLMTRTAVFAAPGSADAKRHPVSMDV